jgi:hypothetical protein
MRYEMQSKGLDSPPKDGIMPTPQYSQLIRQANDAKRAVAAGIVPVDIPVTYIERKLLWSMLHAGFITKSISLRVFSSSNIRFVRAERRVGYGIG